MRILQTTGPLPAQFRGSHDSAKEKPWVWKVENEMGEQREHPSKLKTWQLSYSAQRDTPQFQKLAVSF